MMDADTIAAIATSVGHAGIGIVRVSGPASCEIARTVFRNSRQQALSAFEPRRMIYGMVINPQTDQKIDEALCVFMPGPNSYTSEDVIELQTHGGPLVLRQVLRVVLDQGARMAMPGEFTQRAFLNGRIDLMQAEAVMGVIQAKTEAALRNATQQMAGELSRRIGLHRQALLNELAHIEASLDYPEEDIGSPVAVNLASFLQQTQQDFDKLLASAQAGRVLREGLRTVIIGRPNVGKSTLLNALIGEERALVTDIPGTTRDSIEEYINIRGIPLQIIDTAGLRESTDKVELLGMQRTRASMDSAGLILLMIDASAPIGESDLAILRRLPTVPVIIVVNKIDLPQLADLTDWQDLTRKYPVVSLSAKQKTGLDTLESLIEQMVFADTAHLSIDVCLDNGRQIECLIAAKRSISSALTAIADEMPLDCVAIDLRAAVSALGQITGETVSDEVVREIFAKFCLGK